MRHRVAGKRLGRTTSHRIAMRRNMAVSLFEHGAIRTTAEKAKELRRFVERLITTAKQGTLHARRRVLSELGHDRLMFDDEGEAQDQTVVQKLFDEIAPRYADRPGGYTRMIRLAERRIGDAGSQVVIQLVEESTADAKPSKRTSRRRARAEKRYEAVAAAGTARAKPAADHAPEDEAPDAQGVDEPEAVEEDAAGEGGDDKKED